ncbi:MAG: uL22 family ribosomal protein [Nanoarchaeota archaeon]
MTEKNYNPEQKGMKTAKKHEVAQRKDKIKSDEKAKEKIEEKVKENKEENIKSDEKIEEKESSANKKFTSQETKIAKKDEKSKKTNAVVNAYSIPVSTKQAIAVCRFIKNKKIEDAIRDLEEVIKKKRVVPMRGEIPHQRGNVMSGRYPKKTSQHFIKLLKTLSANSSVNGLNDTIICEAVSNIASRPFGKFGRVRKKRTHVKIVAMERKEKIKSKVKI